MYVCVNFDSPHTSHSLTICIHAYKFACTAMRARSVHVYVSRPLTHGFLSHSRLLIVYRCSTCLKNESDCISTRRLFIYSQWSSMSVVLVTDHNISFMIQMLVEVDEKKTREQTLIKRDRLSNLILLILHQYRAK